MNLRALLSDTLDYLRIAAIGLFWSAVIFLVVDLPVAAKLVVVPVFLSRITRDLIFRETLRVIVEIRREIHYIVVESR